MDEDWIDDDCMDDDWMDDDVGLLGELWDSSESLGKSDSVSSS